MTRTHAVSPSGKPLALRLAPGAAAMRLALLAFAASTPIAAHAVPLANALPTGFSLQFGNVDAPTTQAHVMTILQNSGFAVIDWDTFDIGSNASVVFDQPNASAVVLNRVTGVGRSEIFGSLTGEGTVGVLNSAGVLFGPGSSINVGGLIASSLNLASSNNDGVAVTFDLDFTGASGDGAVINRGDITTGAGGVTFIGRQVINEGTLTVNGAGEAQLIGAEGASLRLPKDGTDPRDVEVTTPTAISALSSGGAAGVRNEGTITAHTITLQAGIAPGLLDRVVNNSGLLVASGVDVQGLRNGGTVRLVSEGAGIAAGDVTTLGFGTAQDGTVEVTTDGSVRLGALNAGDTGTVTVDAGDAVVDENAGAVNVTARTLSVQAGGKVDLDTDVARLGAQSTGGRIGIDEADGLETATLQTNTGRIELTANGTIDSLKITSVTGSGGGGASVVTSAGDIRVDEIAMGDQTANVETVRLEATNGAILDDVEDNQLDIGAGRVELVAGTGIGTSSDGPLDLVGHVDLTVTGTGDIDVRGAAFFGLSAQTANGSINVAAGTLFADNVVSQTDADGNDINLSANANLSIGNVDAGTLGDVKLVARDNILEIANLTTDITGDRVVLRAGRDILAQSGDGFIETQANELRITGGTNTQDVRIAEVDDVRVGFDGAANLVLRAGGSIDVASIDNADHDTSLRAGGAITDGNGAATNVRGTGLSATAADGIDLDTDVDAITARVTGTGDLTIDEANALTLDATAADGAIGVSSAGGVVTIRSAKAKGGADDDDIRVDGLAIILDGSGGPAVGAAGDGDVRLTATQGRIVDNQDAGADGVDVRGDAVTMTSMFGIGSAEGNRTIETDAGQLRLAVTDDGSIDIADAGNVVVASATTAIHGDITIRADGDLTARSVIAQPDSTGRTVELRAGGDLVAGDIGGRNVLLIANGAITDRNGDATNVTADGVRLRAGNGIDLDTDVATIDAISTLGDVDLADAGDVQLNGVTASSGDVRIGAAGTLGTGRVRGNNVTLAAGGAIADTNGDAVDVIAPGVLTATSGNGGIDLDTSVASVAAQVTGAGDVDLENAGALIVSDLATADGDVAVLAHGALDARRVNADDRTVALKAAGADLTAGAIRGGDVSLVAGGAILDGNGNTTNVSGGSLVARSTIGMDLDTNVDRIAAHVSGTGMIALDERNAVTLADVTTQDGRIDVTAGGTMTLGRVSAADGNGDVQLGSTAGAIVDDVNDDAVDVEGGAVNLSAAKGIGNIATGSIDTRVTALGLSTAGGDIRVDQAGDLSLTGVTTADGNVIVNATRELSADAVSASGLVALASGNRSDLRVGAISGQSVRLVAGNAIVDTNGAATNVSGGTLLAEARHGVDLDTAMDSITARSTGRGSVTLDEVDAVTLDDIVTPNGTVSITAGGTLTASQVDVRGGNDVTLTTTAGNLIVGDLLSRNGSVHLVADTADGQQVVDDGRGGTRVRAETLDIAARSGIGAVDAPLDTSVGTLRAQTTTGPIAIRETDGLALALAVTGGGDVSVRAGGDLVAGDVDAGTGDVDLTSTGGTLADDGDDTTRVAGGALTARGATGVSLDTSVQRVSATAGAGDVRIGDQGGNLEVASIRGDAVTLAASGALLGTGDTPNVRATSLDATAGGRINLSTEVATLAARVTGAGSITVAEATSVALTDVSAMAGDVTVTAGGDLVTGTVRGDTMRLVAGGAISDANGAGTVNTTGGTLIADAVGDIDLDTEVDTIQQATSANGDVTIREATNAAIGTVRAKTASLIAGGAFTDANGDDTNVTADTLVARAADGIDLDTRIDTLDAAVTGGGDLDIADFNGLTVLGARTDGGDLHLSTGNGGNLLILDVGAIDAGDGDITLDVAGGVHQEGRRPDASISGGSLTITADGNVGQLLAPLFVNIDGPVTITFLSDRPVALVTGLFGSLNEGGQVFGLGQNTELSNSVGAIQSSFQKTVTFNLDSSQFAVQTRIYTTEGTGILLPEEVRE